MSVVIEELQADVAPPPAPREEHGSAPEPEPFVGEQVMAAIERELWRIARTLAD